MTSQRRSADASALLAFVALLVAPAAAAELTVVITEPQPARPVYGRVEFAAEILSDAAVRRVEFFVDGAFVGARESPPFRIEVDVGDQNVEHRFEVVAQDATGRRGSALLVSRRIPVDEEIELDLQQLYVTVSSGDERILDLEADEFVVLDQGREQRLVTFERGDVPLVALLLVDASDSMRGERLEAATAGARAFIAGMNPLDQTRLLLFSDRIVHTTPFTSFPEVLSTGLGGIEASGDTALNDHLYLALRQLDVRQGRRVVVLLSDGIDVASVLRAREVRLAARRSPALIYWIRLGRPEARATHTSAWRDAAEHRREYETLEQIVHESGGRILTLSRIGETAAAFTQILRELRDQYVLGYYPTVNRGDGAWHPVEVRVGRRGLAVRTRAGYYDD